MSTANIVTHKCSFCEKDNSMVRHMVAGSGVSICDECILSCVEVVFKGSTKKEQKDETGA